MAILDANEEGATALEEFAAALTLANANIATATKNVQNVCNQESDSLGVHANAFSDLLRDVADAQATAAEAIEELPPKMKISAALIRKYVAMTPKA